jgi:hypothetical protein
MFENIRQDFEAQGGDWGRQGFWMLVFVASDDDAGGGQPTLLRRWRSGRQQTDTDARI